MATETVTRPQDLGDLASTGRLKAETAQPTTAPKTVDFGLETTGLTIDAGASLMSLADDCNCLFSAGLSALEGMTDATAEADVPDEIAANWWAMLYALRQANGVFGELYDAVHSASRISQQSQQVRSVAQQAGSSILERLTQEAGELACLVALACELADKANNEGDQGAAWRTAALLRAIRSSANALHDAAGAAA